MQASSVAEIVFGSFVNGQKTMSYPMSLDGYYRDGSTKSAELLRHRAKIKELEGKRQSLLTEMGETLSGLGKLSEQDAAKLAKLKPSHDASITYIKELWSWGGARGWAEHLSNVWKDPKFKNVFAEHMKGPSDGGYATGDAKIADYEKKFGESEAGFQTATKELIQSLSVVTPEQHKRLAKLHKELSEVNQQISDHVKEVMILLEK